MYAKIGLIRLFTERIPGRNILKGVFSFRLFKKINFDHAEKYHTQPSKKRGSAYMGQVYGAFFSVICCNRGRHSIRLVGAGKKCGQVSSLAIGILLCFDSLGFLSIVEVHAAGLKTDSFGYF